MAPTTRADCETSPRPCPWIRCKWHLFWEYNGWKAVWKCNRSVIADFILAMRHTCTLDVADAGEATLEEIGLTLNISRERARQIEGLRPQSVQRGNAAIFRLRHSSRANLLKDFWE